MASPWPVPAIRQIMEGRTAVIPLLAMVQLAEAIGPDDNWTGVIDKAERKKRQNRLNRRASRECLSSSTHIQHEPAYRGWMA